MESISQSLFQRLWERRFIQFTISYLLGAFGLVQLIEWVANRFHLSQHWPEIVFLFLLAMLPAVLVFIYNHGKPGPDALTKTERILIPANLVAALGLVTFLFWNKPLTGS